MKTVVITGSARGFGYAMAELFRKNNFNVVLCDISEGNILWETPFINFIRDNETCDIQCRGRHFPNIIDFMDYEW